MTAPGNVMAEALATIYWSDGGETVVGSPGDIIDVPVDEAAGLAARGFIRLVDDAKPDEPPAA